MELGVHISSAGSLIKSLERANHVGCEVMQVFTSNPRGWNFKVRPKEELEEFCHKQKAFGIQKAYGHSIYLTNLAAPNPYIYTNSINSLISGLVLAHNACFSGVVTHIGSHGGEGPEKGIPRIVNALKQALEVTEENVPIILETSAGSGNHIGNTFEEIAQIINQVDSKKVMVCIDTAHIFAAGYDISTPQGFEDALGRFDKTIGLGRLALLHLNDSKVNAGSKVDRHEEIGKGKIGLATFEYILNHPKLINIPGIIETPENKDTEVAERLGINILKELRKC